MDREGLGPEFDDRLIKLVKENSAIYDVSHPHYRRTPVRMAIWDNIAKQLGAPSRLLQTKWKNIRYNYLQEQKCIQTGTINTNIRKRRFTEDLSFLKYTAYRRDTIPAVKSNCNGSDDSNSCINADNFTSANTYEVIEIDQSEDETEEFLPDVSAFLAPMSGLPQDSIKDCYDQPDNPEEICEKNCYNKKDMTIQDRPYKPVKSSNRSISPTNSHNSSQSSLLLTPLSTTIGIANETKCLGNGNSQYSELTIQPLPSAAAVKHHKNVYSDDRGSPNGVKYKSTQISNDINSDPIEMYCLSLADCFRAMPRSERERVKYEFAKILKDAYYKDQL